MPRTHRFVAALLMAGAAASARGAAAQDVTTEDNWEVEIHVGIAGVVGRGGAASLRRFPPGEPFAAAGGAGATSRAVSSWFFGDGAALFNQVAAASGVSASIAPLDGELEAGVTRLKSGPTAGVTAARWLSRRLALQVHGDVSPVAVVMAERTLAAIERTSLSYTEAWDRYLQSRVVPGRVPSEVLVAGDADRGGGHQLLAIAEIKAVVRQRRRSRMYVAGGLGVQRTWNRAPHATLAGSYRFSGVARQPSGTASLVPIAERDEIAIDVQLGKRRAAVGSIRGGFEYYAESTRGFRLDVALLLSPHTAITSVDANPSFEHLEPGGVVSGTTNPTIQFANDPSGPAHSSLSGPRIDDLVTFTRKGVQVQLKISAGYFWRF
jgi:hypothetical protein